MTPAATTQIELDNRPLPAGISSLETVAALIDDELSDEARQCVMSFHYNLEEPKSAKGFALFDYFSELRMVIFKNREIILLETQILFPNSDPHDCLESWLDACDSTLGIVRVDLNKTYQWQKA